MTDRVASYFQQIELLKSRFYSWTGLLVCLLVAIPAVNGVLLAVKKFGDFDDSRLRFITGGLFGISVNILIIVMIVGVWLIKRRIPIFQEKQIGVLFGPRYKEEIVDEIADTEQKLRELIAETDFARHISVKRLPPNIKTGSHNENIRILAKSNARLLICGNFETVTAKGRKLTGFTSLTISTQRLPIRPDSIHTILGDAISGRQVGWDTENTIDKKVVADNLSEIARYIAAFSLIADSRYDDAKLLIGPLLLGVNAKYSSKRLPIEVKWFVSSISDLYIVSLVESVKQRYRKELFGERIFQLQPKNLQGWEISLKEALKIQQQNPYALGPLTIVQFLSGNIPEAFESIRMARNSTPIQKHWACDLSEAFLLAFTGKLREAKKLYKKAADGRVVPDSRVLSEVLRFLEQVITAYPDKPQLQFAYAFLCDEFGDRTLAEREFKEFCSKVDDNSNEPLKRWAREARLRVERIKRNTGLTEE